MVAALLHGNFPEDALVTPARYGIGMTASLNAQVRWWVAEDGVDIVGTAWAEFSAHHIVTGTRRGLGRDTGESSAPRDREPAV